MKNFLLLIVLLFAVAAHAEDELDYKETTKVQTKYGVTLVFDVVEFSGGCEDKVVDIAVKGKDGKLVKYKLTNDDGAREMGNVFYYAVFSPGGKYFLLPTDRFAGFIFGSPASLEDVVKGKTTASYFDFVEEGESPPPIRRFEKWINADVARISIAFGGVEGFIDVNLAKRKIEKNSWSCFTTVKFRE